jgi:chromosome segregation protein
MKGFKSFGNRVEMVFGSGYNCILGPNGAGKSNVMDALCFVLGKGSAKELRVEKASNLIYNGGKTKEPAKFAEVSIYFDNSDKRFPIESAEIKITRIVKQAGVSIYKINDERMTRQQVLDLLSSSSIDPDGYNIILQGDIVRLVVMSTVERRQIIEEIAGISIYEEKKNKAMNELQKVDEKINEAEIILKEREAYLKELRKERDQALKYKDLNDKVARNKATLLSIKIKKKEDEKANFEEEINKYDAVINRLNKEIEDSRKKINEMKEEISKVNKEVEQKGEKEQVAMLKESEKLKVSIETNKARVGFCENEILRISTRKSQLIATLSELDAKITDLEKEKSSSEKNKAY